jgi:hypothetical protein
MSTLETSCALRRTTPDLDLLKETLTGLERQCQAHKQSRQKQAMNEPCSAKRRPSRLAGLFRRRLRNRQRLDAMVPDSPRHDGVPLAILQ